MKIKKIRALIDDINLESSNNNDVLLYAPDIISSDPIGRDLLDEYLSIKRKKVVYKYILRIYSIYYFSILFLAPILSTYFEQSVFIYWANVLSFGLTRFLFEIIWYWELVIHFVAIFLSSIIFSTVESKLPTLHKSEKNIGRYIEELRSKGEISRENVLSLKTQRKNKFKRSTPVQTSTVRTHSNPNIFIVHGHDNLSKTEVARFIEGNGLEAVILNEKSSSGKTIIEKIEEYSNVAFAIVLLTPDDKGCAFTNSEYLNLRVRARQNVIFEHGYLMSKLGRERVCALVKGNVEIPSDLMGIVYVTFDEDGAWKMKIANEMKTVGIDINLI